MQDALDEVTAALAALEDLMNTPRKGSEYARRVLLKERVHARLLAAKLAIETEMNP